MSNLTFISICYRERPKASYKASLKHEKSVAYKKACTEIAGYK